MASVVLSCYSRDEAIAAEAIHELSVKPGASESNRIRQCFVLTAVCTYTIRVWPQAAGGESPSAFRPTFIIALLSILDNSIRSSIYKYCNAIYCISTDHYSSSLNLRPINLKPNQLLQTQGL